MISRKNAYNRSMNKISTPDKGVSTSSVFGTISSILTNGKKANIKTSSNSEERDIEIMLPYGIASFGFVGMKAHILKTGNKSSIVATYDNKRPSTKKGEVVIYTRDGTRIKLDNNGNIKIKCDKTVEIDGNLKVTGKINGKEI